MIRNFGYKESPEDKMGAGHPTHLLSVTQTIPEYASLREHVIEVLDQKTTNACVAHAVAQQIRTSLKKQGVKAPALPSRLYIYYGARALNGDQNFDGGTYIHSAYEFTERLGYPPELEWDFSDNQDKVNSQPDLTAIHHAADQKWLTGHYRITSTGLARVYDVRSAIAAGYSVVWGTVVDGPFMDLSPGKIWPGVTSAERGGHATLIVGYGPGYFEICNSWSNLWCDAGFCRVSDAAVASVNARDFWVSTIAPQFTGKT